MAKLVDRMMDMKKKGKFKGGKKGGGKEKTCPHCGMKMSDCRCY